jgi:hypothetical protein
VGYCNLWGGGKGVQILQAASSNGWISEGNMVLTVAIEEACLHPDYPEISTKYIKPTGPGPTPILKKLTDIHGRRLDLMLEHGNEYQVLSLTSPGPQGEPDVAKVEMLYELP